VDTRRRYYFGTAKEDTAASITVLVDKPQELEKVKQATTAEA